MPPINTSCPLTSLQIPPIFSQRWQHRPTSSDTCDAITANSPLVPASPSAVLVPLFTRPANMLTSPLLPGSRKPAPPSLLSAACHAHRAQHLVCRPTLGTICFAGHLTILGLIHTLRMFSVSLFCLRLVAPFFSPPLVSFVIGLRLSLLPSALRSLSCLDVVFSEYQNLLSHTPCRTLPFDFFLFSPTFPLSA